MSDGPLTTRRVPLSGRPPAVGGAAPASPAPSQSWSGGRTARLPEPTAAHARNLLRPRHASAAARALPPGVRVLTVAPGRRAGRTDGRRQLLGQSGGAWGGGRADTRVAPALGEQTGGADAGFGDAIGSDQKTQLRVAGRPGA